MSIVIINSSNNYEIVLDKQKAIELELKLNVSSKGHELKEIGDFLYIDAVTANRSAL